ncbi:prepilin-type N-terminal cleavage/methylation domain-containing protein [Microbacterium sp.]|uniref:type IV pilus modification PilV family protein n=1 Tax=Microbacterium sp. TaxID=51671 RepID=UPI0037C52C47
MRGRGSQEAGLSLVEVVIAMFLIGLIAVALLPALWQGIALSSQQSATATATRHLYALIEDARAVPTCATLGTITAPDSIPDGKGANLAIAGTYDAGACSQGEAVAVTLTATDASGAQLARVDAQVYIP